MDNLDMFFGESVTQEAATKSESSHVCEEGEIVGTNQGIIIPWALVQGLFAKGELTKSGKEVKAFITIPRGGVKVGNKLLNKVRFGIGAYLKP